MVALSEDITLLGKCPNSLETLDGLIIVDNHDLGMAYHDFSARVAVLVDIELFKNLNDDFDYLTGGNLLAEFAHLIGRRLRSTAVRRTGARTDSNFRYPNQRGAAVEPRTMRSGGRTICGVSCAAPRM